jgi:hypothetical protein
VVRTGQAGSCGARTLAPSGPRSFFVMHRKQRARQRGRLCATVVIPTCPCPSPHPAMTCMLDTHQPHANIRSTPPSPSLPHPAPDKFSLRRARRARRPSSSFTTPPIAKSMPSLYHDFHPITCNVKECRQASCTHMSNPAASGLHSLTLPDALHAGVPVYF